MDREKRTTEYLAARARPLEKKRITLDKGKTFIEVIAGMCPCEICGHEYMWECEDADCQCCSSLCT